MRLTIPTILFTITTAIVFNSCTTSSYAWKDYNKDDAIFFNFSSNDTILDYETKNLFFDNYLFSQDSTLKFYLTCKDFERKNTQNTIDKYSKKYFQSNFKSSINLISSNTISLNSNSMTKILLTKINLRYNKIDPLLNELKRIIKPDGKIIVSVTTIQSHDVKKFPNEESIINFFKSKGFEILKQKSTTVKGEKGVYTILILGKSML